MQELVASELSQYTLGCKNSHFGRFSLDLAGS